MYMEKLIVAGRIFYGTCMVALGIQHFLFKNFLPVILPFWPSWMPGVILFAYLMGAILIGGGVLIIFETKAKTVGCILGIIFLGLISLCHIPYQIIHNPYSGHLATWSNTFKLLALSGGAFVVAGSFSFERNIKTDCNFFIRLSSKLIPFGPIFFSVTMITFGIVHLLYVENVAKLVPSWIPGAIFWTYFAAIALIGSGTAIIAKIKLKLVSILLGTMIFLWFILLHIPRAIADPYVNNGNEVTSAFQALGFSGIAFVLVFWGERLKE